MIDSNPHSRWLTAPRLADLAALDDAAFRRLFAGSPVKRTGRDRFVRNVLIAIGNSGLAELAPAARACLDDPSPLVRAMAVWALARLDRDAFAAEQTRHLPQETDSHVRDEWQAFVERLDWDRSPHKLWIQYTVPG